jgi:hypothetical protein
MVQLNVMPLEDELEAMRVLSESHVGGVVSGVKR